MGKEIPPEELLIPPQDSRICGTICICQMTAVLSSVALVYLTVAVYMPSMRAFDSGMIETPVMCTTLKNITVEICEGGGSCGEWCLSKGSGGCTQIFVSMRNNGTNILFQNCSDMSKKVCYGVDKEKVKKYSCIRDQCKNLTGTFNCTMGECINITNVFECKFVDTERPLKCTGNRGKVVCIELDGLYDCSRGKCSRIRPPYNCERKCRDIPTRYKNVIVMSGDEVFLGQCKKGITREDTNDTERVVWKETDDILMTSCLTFDIDYSAREVYAQDCVNGTLLEKNTLGDTTNYTVLSNISYTNSRLLDENMEITPPESQLIIANESKLVINLEGCVNTLRGECMEFFKDYGRDGSDHNARARFPCFYSELDPQRTAVLYFDLEETYKQFMVASILPSVLLVVSCVILVLCQKTVETGEDAKFRFKACSGGDNEATQEEDDGVMAL